MNNNGHEIHDNRNFFQRAVGVLFLDECPKCNRYAFSASSYGYQGSCSVCVYTTPILNLKNKD